MSERESVAGGRNQADTTSITSSIAGGGGGAQGSVTGPMNAQMFAKPPLPSPNGQHLPNSKSTPALHHVGNICKELDTLFI